MSEQGWMNLRENIRLRIVMFYAPGSSCTQPRGSRTMSLPHVSIRRVKLYPSGANAFSSNVFRASMNNRVAGPPHAFPPGVIVAVKALACELPHRIGKPLSRFSLSELRREVVGAGLVASISGTTVWRWLSQDALHPWRHRTWIFPRDPAFAEKAGRILDLYQGLWEGKPLADTDCVLSTDEKTSIQARLRCHHSLPPAPGRPMRVEHEYARGGAWAYLAAWDVRRAKVFGRFDVATGIVPFERLVADVMAREPYRSATRVFWVMDDGSWHRGQASIARLQKTWPTIVPVHTPVHTSWLNQIEVYFSIIQRKVLTPNDFTSLAEVEERLLRFQSHYEQAATPFHWTFTRQDLANLMARIEGKGRALNVAA